MRLIDLHYFLYEVMLRGLGHCGEMSKSQWKKLIEGGSVRIKEIQEKSPSYELAPDLIHTISIGKRGAVEAGVHIFISDCEDDGVTPKRIFTKICGMALLPSGNATDQDKIVKRNIDATRNFNKNFGKYWNEKQQELNQVFPILCLKGHELQQLIKHDKLTISWEVCALKNKNETN
jgi:ribosomal protein S4